MNHAGATPPVRRSGYTSSGFLLQPTRHRRSPAGRSHHRLSNEPAPALLDERGRVRNLPEIYELLPEKGDHEDSTWPMLADRGLLRGYRFEGFLRTIDSPKDVAQAE